ncbi:MAG: UPF0147 family protein [Nanoarchaeota archaeon]|nr:UPF0147 family protein [Nanoarchaeota archaeon]
MSEKVKQAIELLTQIIDDRTVPRNIRENARLAKESLENEKEDLRVRVDKAIQYLDEISEDPNMPVYTRTQIWSIVSVLESILS